MQTHTHPIVDDEGTVIRRDTRPVKVTRDRISWWVGLPPEKFYDEAKRRSADIAESTFGTWSNKAPTAIGRVED